MTTIKDYSLRFYVRDMYVKNAGERGGSVFSPLFKKDKKHFELMVKCAVNMSAKVIKVAKFHFSNN